MNTSYSYIIDENDNIISVDEAWKEFAIGNGSPELIDRVVGNSLWDFIGNKILIGLYQSAAKAVRKRLTDFTMDFRCDSPDTLRFMSMHMIPLPDGRIKFESTVLHSQSRSEPRPLEILKRMEPRALSMCGQCNLVCSDGNWQELDNLIEQRRDNQPIRFQFGLCDRCKENLYAKTTSLDAMLTRCASGDD